MPALSSIELTIQEQQQLVSLVWQVIDSGLAGQGMQLPPPPESETLNQSAACFVTLYVDGKLHGCIGSLVAKEALWKNVCRNAYASGFNDLRFYPLTPEERAGLSVEISILSPMQPMENNGQQALLLSLTPGVDGLLMEDDHHSAVFIPSVWDKIASPLEFVQALKHKAGWPQDYWASDIKLCRFTASVIHSLTIESK